LKYLREVTERYGAKEFLILTYTPKEAMTSESSMNNLLSLKYKIQSLDWVHSVITLLDIPLLHSTDETLTERLQNFSTLKSEGIDKERGFNEILNSPVFRNFVISEDGKTTGIIVNLKKDEKLKKFNLEKRISNIFAIKEAVFPFNKFPNVDVLLGPEMKSTGEVMGIDKNFGLSFAKSQMACGNELPISGTAFISVKDKDKKNVLNFAKKLKELNFKLCATSGTAKYLNNNGINCKKINKVREGSPHIVESLNAKNIELVINTTEGTKSISDSYSLRRSALVNKIPYCTSLAAANACIEAIGSLKNKKITVKAIQEL